MRYGHDMTGHPLLAHETWFVDPPHPGTDWSFATEPLTLTLLAVALVLTVVVRLVARWWPGIDIPFLARLTPFMPFAVRIHLAVSLLGLLSLGSYLAPSMDLGKDVVGVLLGAVMFVVAIGMAAGWHTRAAAWLLIAAGPIGMLEFGFWPVVHRIDVLGLAVCVLIWGAGPWSADHELGRTRVPSLRDDARAIWVLRLAVGLALIIVAFAEKLVNPQLARDFLAEYPHFNVFQELGFGMGNDTFIAIAGAIEVLFGLLIISGALPQVGVVIVGVPFNATLWFFGAPELLGHLPIYGAMLVLLVYGSHPQLRPATRDLWPWGRDRIPAG
ncbi:MAG: hypothetical protein JWM90_1102 [Thermoleophilia bacterium]|nr:hypothetical protein [Thermoleophilia bacterium]